MEQLAEKDADKAEAMKPVSLGMSSQDRDEFQYNYDTAKQARNLVLKPAKACAGKAWRICFCIGAH